MKKVVLISGASSEISRRIIDKFISSGFTVYGGVKESSEKILNTDINFRSIHLDVTKDEICKEAIKNIIKENGRLDVLINAAGLTYSGDALEYSASDLSNIIDINTVGAFRLIKHAYSELFKTRGKIINLVSINGIVSMPHFGLYSASKHALEALGFALHYELKSTGVSVTNILPGAVKKENERDSSKLKHTPLRERNSLFKYLLPMTTNEKLADVIYRIYDTINPPVRVIVGIDAKIVYYVQKLLPQFIQDRIFKYIWQK